MTSVRPQERRPAPPASRNARGSRRSPRFPTQIIALSQPGLKIDLNSLFKYAPRSHSGDKIGCGVRLDMTVQGQSVSYLQRTPGIGSGHNGCVSIAISNRNPVTCGASNNSSSSEPPSCAPLMRCR